MKEGTHYKKFKHLLCRDLNFQNVSRILVTYRVFREDDYFLHLDVHPAAVVRDAFQFLKHIVQIQFSRCRTITHIQCTNTVQFSRSYEAYQELKVNVTVKAVALFFNTHFFEPAMFRD